MELLRIFRDERGVSPVIGVILMVAVTVILAAVIGTFVLGIGSQVTSDTPKVSLGFAFEANGGGFGGDDDTVTITHRGGDGVKLDTLSVKAKGNDLDASPSGFGWSAGGDNELNAGDTGKFGETSGNNEISSGTKVQVIWTDEESEGTAILGEQQVP